MDRGTPTSAGKSSFGHAEVYALFFALSFLAARWLPLLAVPYPCPFRAVTGIPCATCGMTHAFVHLAHGEVGAALLSSPLGALLALGAWLAVPADLVRLALGWPLPSLNDATVRGLAFAGFFALLANWAFLVASSRA
jgi:hypothetical protein